MLDQYECRLCGYFVPNGMECDCEWDHEERDYRIESMLDQQDQELRERDPELFAEKRAFYG